MSNTTRPPALYPYQKSALSVIFDKLKQHGPGCRVLFQLPTGGGKTMIFSELVKQFVQNYNRKALILTHRTELSRQTSSTLKKQGVKNRIINSSVQRVARRNDYSCYVAMVETLKNRIRQRAIPLDNIGLVIIDEAHHNGFQKLIEYFPDAYIIGVTATPLSADKSRPLHKVYKDLIVGAGISELIAEGYLAKPRTISYDVELSSLRTGLNGDYTISTSDELYASQAMLSLLMKAYTAERKKKTLIFNNGVFTSKRVCAMFEEAGYPARHLDNRTSAAERQEILTWFRKTPAAILTSVSILTTGFDEPTVRTIILNRATTSLTLFHQMTGRGSRPLPNKRSFTIIDLGNNVERFGPWEKPVDWQFVFEKPDEYCASLQYGCGNDSSVAHQLPAGLRSAFPNTAELSFDIEAAFLKATSEGAKHKTVIQQSVRQHAMMCIENSSSISEALRLAELLAPEIDWRVRQYARCVDKATKNYRDWLMEDYKARLRQMIPKIMHLREMSVAEAS